MHLGDPLHLLDLTRLDQLSGELSAAATDLTALRSALRSRAGALPWHSPGARSFQSVLHELLVQLTASSSRLTDVAAALRAHRQRAAELAAAARSPLAAVERLARLP